MINEQECTKILNDGELKFTHDEMLLIRKLLSTLALIEFKGYKQKQNKSSKNECNLLQEGKYRRASWPRFQFTASGAYSADEVRRWLNDNNLKIGKQTFLTCIRNPVYMGELRTGEWKKEPSQIVVGLHPSLVTEDIFYRADDVLEVRKRNMKFHDDKSDLYPLKGLLKCPVHDRSLTAYACRSKTGKLHHYYLCCKDKCTQRHRIKDVHDSVEEVLTRISFSGLVRFWEVRKKRGRK